VVEPFDTHTRRSFKLWGAPHCSTNDFLAYANLLGWSTKGHFACPSCAKGTHLIWVESGHKFC